MRLTERNEFGNYIGTNLLDDECICRGLSFDELNEMTNIFNKLGQLEDIEEELGIDLITFFKAFYSKRLADITYLFIYHHCSQNF